MPNEPGNLERRLADFESAWRSGRAPTIGEHVAADSGLLAEIIAIDLEYRWRSDGKSLDGDDAIGLQPRLADYVSVLDHLSSVHDLPAWLVAEEYRVRRLWGDRPTMDHFIAGYPEHLSTLVRLLRVIDNELVADGAARSVTVESRLPSVDDSRVTLLYSDFILQQHLGTGGVGKVYRATQRGREQPVAIKTLLKSRQRSPTAVEQFIRESEIVRQLDHPNIVQSYGLGRFPGGGHFIAMDYVDGGDLATRIKLDPIAVVEAVEITCVVAEAIEYAHKRGVVHCDLKPGNILVSSSGHIYVTDFGFARLLNTNTEPFSVGGTPGYMAPEQFQSEIELGPAVDVYGIGAVLYSLLTSRSPRTAEILDKSDARTEYTTDVQPPGTIRPGIPDEIEQACMRCLEESPADRFSNAQQVATILRQLVNGPS
jgi:predicted Ser/Thr protein kinase